MQRGEVWWESSGYNWLSTYEGCNVHLWQWRVFGNIVASPTLQQPWMSVK